MAQMAIGFPMPLFLGTHFDHPGPVRLAVLGQGFLLQHERSHRSVVNRLSSVHRFPTLDRIFTHRKPKLYFLALPAEADCEHALRPSRIRRDFTYESVEDDTG
jgi:hypothetical protein